MGSGGVPQVKQLRLTPAQLAEMRAHVVACLPLEACGLLAGSNGVVHEVIPVTNEAGSRVRFRMLPGEQLAAFEHIEAEGQDLLAVFHSHPAGPPGPSQTDIAEAAYQAAHIIWSPGEAHWEAHAFWIEGGSVSEVELYVADGDSTSLGPV